MQVNVNENENATSKDPILIANCDIDMPKLFVGYLSGYTYLFEKKR